LLHASVISQASASPSSARLAGGDGDDGDHLVELGGIPTK